MGISSALGVGGLTPGVVTSSTRPTSPYEGQMIYETDTDKVLIWNGSAWNPPWNTAWGRVAYGESTTTTSGFSAETITISAITFTAVANRNYKLTYFEPDVFQNSAAQLIARIRLNNVSGTVQQTVIDSDANANVTTAFFCNVIKTFSAGSVTLVATLSCDAGQIQGTRSSTKIAYLSVEDIGPA